MLGTRRGMLSFVLRRNDLLWERLTPEEKQIVLKNNARHNTSRPSYVEPVISEEAKTYDSFHSHDLDFREQSFRDFLNRVNPESVLEIGPGLGFLTRMAVDHPSVKFYYGIDINEPFLDYLRPRLQRLQKSKPGFEFALQAGDFNALDLPERQFDAISLFSAVHHIPDRIKLFQKLASLLAPEGRLFTGEPAHYLSRRLRLFDKYRRTYSKTPYWSNLDNYSTHHFCTIEEYRRIVGVVDSLRIVGCQFHRIGFPKLFKPLAPLLLALGGAHPAQDGTLVSDRCRSFIRWFSDRIVVEFERLR